MTDVTIDLTHSLEKAQSGKNNPPQELVLKTLGKFDVNFEDIRKEVHILNFEIVQSQEKDTNSIFKEFDSVSYRINFVTYNVEYLLRLLTFHNDAQSQILKLDIQAKTIDLKKEFEYCCNSLQRRRNLDLMFKTIIKFSRFIEGRRLICDLILKKDRYIEIKQNKDGGIIILYTDDRRNVGLGIFWSIACNSTHDITDIIEVYYKFVDLSFPNKSEIENQLNMLTEPCLDFTKKYHLWLSLIDNLSGKTEGKTLRIVIDKMPDNSTNPKRTLKKAQPIDVTLLSDSEEPSGLGKISEDSSIRKVLAPYTNRTKAPKAHNVTVLSDSEELSQKSLAVKVDKVPKDSTRSVDKKNDKERDDQDVTVLSDSEESSQKSLVVKIDKMSEDSTRNVLSLCCNNNKEKEIRNVTVLSDSEELSQKSFSVESDKVSKDATRSVDKNNDKERDEQEVTLLSDSEESSQKSLVVKIDKMSEDSTRNVLSPCPNNNKEKEIRNVTVLSDSEESSQKSLVVKVDKVSEHSIRKVLLPCSNNIKERECQNVSLLSDTEDSSRKSLVVEIDKMPENSTNKILPPHSDKKEKESQVSTVISSSSDSSKKSLIVKVAKLQDDHSTIYTLNSQKNIRKAGVVSSENEESSEDDESSKGNECSNYEESSEDDVKESKDDKDMSTAKLVKTTEIPKEVLSYLQLKKVKSKGNIETSLAKSKVLRSKFSKNKVVELESSDSEFMSKKLCKKKTKKKKPKDFSSDEDYTPSEDDKKVYKAGRPATKNSGNYRRINANEFSSSGDDDTFLPNKFLDMDDVFKPKMIQVPKKRRKKRIALCPSRRSPRVSSTVEKDDSLTPSARSELLIRRRSLRSGSKMKTIQSPVITSTPTRNVTIPTPSRDVVLITDQKALNSVLPNDLLNILTPRRSDTPSTPARNVRIRLIPDAPLNKTPGCVELNLFTPSKKPRFEPKKIDDDLEITSVTYLVPD